jgi:transcriptional regulator with XRE-family HTH domain
LTPDPWRLIVKIKSRRTLKEYAKFHQLSGRALAKKAGLSPAIVNHLMSGERDTCNLETARKLEEALQCPPGFLFEPSMSRVADTARQGAA